jgi:[ribosomal protein S5]-alanine N-acetyltransferase
MHGRWRPSSTPTLPELRPPNGLTDGRVTLRAWRAEDEGVLVRRISDPLVATFLDQIPYPYTRADARAWFGQAADGWASGTMASFAIEVDGVEGAAGGIGIRWLEGVDEGGAELGYWVGEDARGLGVATAAARLASAWAFEADPALVRLQLRADVQNEPSNRVAEKVGFRREGVLRAQRFNARLGRRVDFVMWSLLRDEV